MDDTEDDDFGGFEVADADDDSEPVGFDPVIGEDSASTSGPDVSAIPWLAASIQAASTDHSVFSSDEKSTTADALSEVDVVSVFDQKQPAMGSESESRTESAQLSDLQAQLDNALEDKHTYRSESAELKLKHEVNLQSMTRLETELANQKKVYAELQDKHAAELEEMKKENSKALTMVIDEYKESMKLCIIEQQKASTQVFNELLEDECKQVQRTLDQQLEKFESWKADFNESLKERHEEELTKLRQEIVEEKQTLKETFKTESEKTKELLSVHKAEALLDIQSQLTNKMSELEIKAKDIIGESTEDLKESIKSQSKVVSDQERTISMDYWEKQSCVMMKDLQESLEKAVKSQRESMDDYISQRIQADQSMQRKQLSAVNVYLDAASKHIATLTEGDNST